jgi:hypothetical protein
VAAVAALALLLTACVVSIEPLIPESESTFEPALLGRWVQEGSGETAVISDAGDGGYLIDYVDAQGGRGRFAGRLGWLDEHLVLEVTPVLPDMDASAEYEALILPARVQIAVMVRVGTVQAAVLDPDSLRSMLRRDATRIPHLTDLSSSDEDIVLTGTTAETRTWLVEYLTLPGVLGEPVVWRSVEPGP